MSPAVKDWLLSAEMDIENVRMILDNDFLTPIAVFHSHQAIEKSFKAYLEFSGRNIPKTHDLLRLFNMIRDLSLVELDEDLLVMINETYIDSRYPGDFGLMPDGKPSKETAEQIFCFSKRVFKFINEKVS